MTPEQQVSDLLHDKQMLKKRISELETHADLLMSIIRTLMDEVDAVTKETFELSVSEAEADRERLRWK